MDLVPVAALIISLASLGLSAYVFVVTRRDARIKLHGDVLIMLAEARSRYRELNRRFRKIASRSTQLEQSHMKRLLEYQQFEENVDQRYAEVSASTLSTKELELLRRTTQAMLIAIAADIRRLDEIEP